MVFFIILNFIYLFCLSICLVAHSSSVPQSSGNIIATTKKTIINNKTIVDEYIIIFSIFIVQSPNIIALIFVRNGCGINKDA